MNLKHEMGLQYEYLLRAVYQSNRDYKLGADADIYREMERAFTNLTAKALFKSQDDREYEFRKSFAAVRNHVWQALNKGIEQIQFSASPDDLQKMKKMRSKLTLDFYDKDQLDEFINLASEILKANSIIAK